MAVPSYWQFNGGSFLRPSQGVPVPFFPEKNRHFPLFHKIKILIFYVPFSPEGFCFPVVFNFRLLFPCSPEINGLMPLFSKPLGGPPSYWPFHCGSFLLTVPLRFLLTDCSMAVSSYWPFLPTDRSMAVSSNWPFHGGFFLLTVPWRFLPTDRSMAVSSYWPFHGRSFQLAVPWRFFPTDRSIAVPSYWSFHGGSFLLTVPWRFLITEMAVFSY